MKSFYVLTIIATFFSLLSCSNNNMKISLTREDSLAICKAMALKTDTSRKFIFATEFGLAPKPWRLMQRYHLDYLENPLDIYSSDDPSKKVRYFNIELNDIEIIQKAMKGNFGGLRIYLGYDTAQKVYRLILVGVDKTTGANHLVDSEIFDDFRPCPTQCISDSPVPAVQQTDLNYDDTQAGPPVFRNPK